MQQLPAVRLRARLQLSHGFWPAAPELHAGGITFSATRTATYAESIFSFTSFCLACAVTIDHDLIDAALLEQTKPHAQLSQEKFVPGEQLV